ncbi:MAG TPA: glycosyltransferase family 39 protein, partial [Anaerolineae bacterium]|nr:glycosyltransferase family 39 protein [Anaerolineae bacterium]
AREFSVLLGALTVLFTYGIALEVLPRRPGLALAAAAVVACTPMFLFISGSVNNDNLLVALATIAFWLLLRLLRQPPSWRGWALLGGVIGLAALSKVSALGLLPMAALGLAWLAWRRRDWKLFFWGGTCVVGAAALVAGWWYVRNWLLYGDPLGFNAFVAIAGPRYPRPTLRQLLGEWQGFVMAYWGFFGGVNVAAPGWFYRVYNALALLGLSGLGVGAVRWIVTKVRSSSRSTPAGVDATMGASRSAPTDADTAFRLFLVGLWPLLVMAGLVRWTMLTIASQGRLIFPAIASLSFLMVLGWAGWLPEGGKRKTYCVKRKESIASRITHHVLRFTFYVSRAAPLALMAALAVWTPFAVIAPAYARPPLLTPAQQAAVPERLDLVLGDRMELLGYELGASEVRPGEALAVTLYWRARAPLPANYSVFVHLLADNEIILGQRDVYPGRGNLPTSLWQPGDAIADTYIIPVSPTAFSPSRAVVEVGLYRQESGERLPICDAQGTPIGDHVRFGEVWVRAEARDGLANPLDFNLDNTMALVGYDMDRTALRPGETLHLTLYWKALAPMAHNYTVFAHVLGANDSIWAQKDAWPQDGAAPTSTWAVGQMVADRYDLVVKPETPVGLYELEVGVYLGETLERLSILGPGGHAQDTRVLLNRVRVLP